MISSEAREKYRESFPECNCFCGEPFEYLILGMADETADEEARIQSEEETEEQFPDRIERSKKAGRNLFFGEWTVHVDDENRLY